MSRSDGKSWTVTQTKKYGSWREKKVRNDMWAAKEGCIFFAQHCDWIHPPLHPQCANKYKSRGAVKCWRQSVFMAWREKTRVWIYCWVWGWGEESNWTRLSAPAQDEATSPPAWPQLYSNYQPAANAVTLYLEPLSCVQPGGRNLRKMILKKWRRGWNRENCPLMSCTTWGCI